MSAVQTWELRKRSFEIVPWKPKLVSAFASLVTEFRFLKESWELESATLSAPSLRGVVSRRDGRRGQKTLSKDPEPRKNPTRGKHRTLPYHHLNPSFSVVFHGREEKLVSPHLFTRPGIIRQANELTALPQN